jgi:hypothetical protein
VSGFVLQVNDPHRTAGSAHRRLMKALAQVRSQLAPVDHLRGAADGALVTPPGRASKHHEEQAETE